MQLVYSCVGSSVNFPIIYVMLWMYCYTTLFPFVYKTSYFIASYVISDIHWLNNMIQNNVSAPNFATIAAAMATTNNGCHGYYQQWLPWLLLTMFTMDSTNNGYHNYYQQWLLHMWKVLRVKILQLYNVQKLSHYNDIPYTSYCPFININISY